MAAHRSHRNKRLRLICAAQTIGHLRWHSSTAGGATLDIPFRREVTRPAIRVFLGIAIAWRMSFREQMTLLALPRPIWSKCVRRAEIVLPAETLKRIALVARVFESINMLLPPDRADAWMRAPNAAAVFDRCSALEFMLQEGRYGISVAREYLLGELFG